MTISGQNFEIYQGDSKELEILVLNENGLPADLTPYTLSEDISWVAYHKTTKATVLLKTYGDGITVPTPTDGIIKITIDPADTVNLIPNIYNHECKIASSATDESTVSTGTMSLIFSKL